MAKVKRKNLEIPQGTTFRYEFYYVDSAKAIVPLTGYTARCQFRSEVTSPAEFFEATTENGGLTIDGAAGKVTLYIAPDTSSAWTVYDGSYDLEIIAPNTDVTRIIQGNVIIDPEVTR